MSTDIKLFESVCKQRAGGNTTKAVTRTIASTGLSRTDVLLREAIQNSYDAKLDNKKPLNVALNCYKFDKEQWDKIEHLLLDAGAIGEILGRKISSTFYNLEITDRNSTGLIGYPGFQENIREGIEEKFHHFIYMTGNDEINKDKNSGGSFGFGKAALYKYSFLRTIVVYSRIQSNGQFQTRFIICKIDEREPDKISRCWWGAEGHYEDGITYAKPILNKDADNLAKLFGMQPFYNDETGTDILILNAEKNVDIDSFATTFEEEIPVKLTHWFWAKMVSPNVGKKIEFTMSLNNEDITVNIPDPKDTYPYSCFVRAYQDCCDYYTHKSGVDHSGITIVNHGKPVVDIGGIFLRKTGLRDYMFDKYISVDWKKPVIALMRDVEFIVEYHEVNIDTNNLHVNCFGVFHTNRLGCSKNSTDPEEVEHYFRDIENQTHDKWTHSENFPNNYLLTLQKQIPDAVKKFLDIKTNIGNAASISGLVAQKFGSKLGFGFVGGASDPRTDIPSGAPGEKRSTFSRRDAPIEIEKSKENKKIVKIQYDAKIIQNKPLTLSMIPVIKSSDPHDSQTALTTELKILNTSFTGRDKMTLIAKPKQPGNVFTIEKSGVYTLSVEADIQCAFDINVKRQD